MWISRSAVRKYFSPRSPTSIRLMKNLRISGVSSHISVYHLADCVICVGAGFPGSFSAGTSVLDGSLSVTAATSGA